MASCMDNIVPVKNEDEISSVRRLFQEYAGSLSIDLCFQNFETELASLPGDYAPPRGALFLAQLETTPVGCIGLRPFSDSVGELKRLYVLPECRGRGLAHALIQSAVQAAREIGYHALVLDTLASMKPAIALYEKFGFHRTEAYYPNPLPDVVYFRLNLK